MTLSNISIDVFNIITMYLDKNQFQILSKTNKHLNSHYKNHKQNVYDSLNSYDLHFTKVDAIIKFVPFAFEILNIIINRLLFSINLTYFIKKMLEPIIDYKYNVQESNSIEFKKTKLKNTKYMFEVLKIVKHYYVEHGIDYQSLDKQLTKFLSKVYTIQDRVIVYFCPEDHKQLTWDDNIFQYVCKHHHRDLVVKTNENNTRYINTSYCFHILNEVNWESLNINVYSFIKHITLLSYYNNKSLVSSLTFQDKVINSWFIFNQNYHKNTIEFFSKVIQEFGKKNEETLSYIQMIIMKYHIFMIQNQSKNDEYNIDYINNIAYMKFLNIVDDNLDKLPKTFKNHVVRTSKKFGKVTSKLR